MLEHCILITDCDHYLAADAINLCRSHFRSVVVCDEDDVRIGNGALADMACDLLISFLSERILPKALLKFPNINFHPGPPQYPGRGGASYALFEGAKTYGATAHTMAESVDAGAILLVEVYPVFPYDCCESLFAKSERSCMDLLAQALAIFDRTGLVPPPNGMKWARSSGTRKQFDQWLLLDPSDKDSFDRKLFAAYHSRFPGPYVIVHGVKFGLVKDANTERVVGELRQKLRS